MSCAADAGTCIASVLAHAAPQCRVPCLALVCVLNTFVSGLACISDKASGGFASGAAAVWALAEGAQLARPAGEVASALSDSMRAQSFAAPAFRVCAPARS